jgi:hypothetical protein
MNGGDGYMAVSFNSVPSVQQSFVVPNGALFMTVDMLGARGGNVRAGLGGLGAGVHATFAVTPGTTYYFNIGGHGMDVLGSNMPGGYNGGMYRLLSHRCAFVDLIWRF